MQRNGEAQDLKPVYLIVGEDPYFFNQSLKKLKQRLEREGDLLLDYQEFEAPELDPEALINALRTPSFLSGKRVVVLKRIEQLREADRQRLKEYLQDPADSSSLILQLGDPKKGGPWRKMVGARGEVREKKKYTWSQLRSWVRQKVGQSGKSISGDALQELILRVGPDLERMEKEMEKLFLYYADDQEIKKAGVGKIVSPSIESSVFHLLNAVGRRKAEESLSTFRNLMVQEKNPLGLLALLARHFRHLILAKSFYEQGRSQRQIEESLQVRDFVAASYLEQIRNFTNKQLTNVYRLILETEYRIKSGELEPTKALELLIVGIIKVR